MFCIGCDITSIQVLHNLSMWSATDKVMTYDQTKADAIKAKKDMKMVPAYTLAFICIIVDVPSATPLVSTPPESVCMFPGTF